MLKRRRFWITLIVILLLAGAGGYYYWTTTAVSAPVTEQAAIQTAVVRQGDLTISATGAGTIVPAAQIDLGFATSGTLVELPVTVGQKVQAGDLLARIDDTNLQEALTNAQLQLAQATMQTDASATQVGVSYDDISVEQATLNLELAQTALDDLVNWEPDPDAVALAEANLASAKASLQAASGQEAATGYSNQVSQISLEQAQRALDNAQAAYDTAFDPGREWETFYNERICLQGQGGAVPCTGQKFSERIASERASAESGLQRAQESLQIAQANYNAAIATGNRSSSTNARTSVLSAEQALAAAQTGPTDEAIEATQVSVRQAELSLKQAQLNKEANGLSLQQAQLNVAAAEAALSEASLLAPVDGTVLAINADVGENAGTAVLITLADLERPLVEIYIDESDLDKVGLGFEVDVTFDALPDDTFTGTITQVDPQLSVVNGVTAIRALVQLNADSFSKPQTLPIGLNATVEVIGGRATNALLVPVEALREISPGEYALFVMENDEPKLTFVEVGLMDFTFAEIKSGVQAGDIVTTGVIETQ